MINKDFISICFIVITKGLTKFSYRQLLTKSENNYHGCLQNSNTFLQGIYYHISNI